MHRKSESRGLTEVVVQFETKLDNNLGHTPDFPDFRDGHSFEVTGRKAEKSKDRVSHHVPFSSLRCSFARFIFNVSGLFFDLGDFSGIRGLTEVIVPFGLELDNHLGQSIVPFPFKSS